MLSTINKKDYSRTLALAGVGGGQVPASLQAPRELDSARSPSPLPARKGLLGFPKHVISSTTARHCYSRASSCRADRAVAGRARGRGETWVPDRGWQPDRNLETCLLLKWENRIFSHLLWKTALVGFLDCFSPPSLSSIWWKGDSRESWRRSTDDQGRPSTPISSLLCL